jgi:hypothetical protein
MAAKGTPIKTGTVHNGTYLSSQLSSYQSSYGRIIDESFCECLGGYAACGLLRKNSHRLSGLEIFLAFIFWICFKKPCFRMNVSAIGDSLLNSRPIKIDPFSTPGLYGARCVTGFPSQWWVAMLPRAPLWTTVNLRSVAYRGDTTNA